MNINNQMFQLINLLAQSKDPQSAVMKMVQDNASKNPVFANMLCLINSGNKQGLEQMARNICKEKGLDFDKEFDSFKKIIKL